MEKRRFYRLFSRILIVIAALAVLFCMASLLFPSYGHMCVRVVDVNTLAPLANAQVVFPEAKRTLLTDGDGVACAYNLPVRKNAAHQRLLAQGFGQTTILCYCKGYHPYALFYAQVTPGVMRSGPTLYMFPASESYGCVIEAPPNDWVDALLRQYAPPH